MPVAHAYTGQHRGQKGHFKGFLARRIKQCCAGTRMASSQRPAVAQAEMSEEKWTVLGRTCGWNSRIAPNTCARPVGLSDAWQCRTPVLVHSTLGAPGSRDPPT